MKTTNSILWLFLYSIVTGSLDQTQNGENMVEIMVRDVINPEEYIQNLKDRVILFPEENIKLEILKKNQTASEEDQTEDDVTEDMLAEPENEPHLKDIFNTSIHSRHRRSRGQRKRNNGWMKAGWTSWGRWSACSQTCGTGGVQSRRRFCANATYGAQSCPGEGTMTQKCFITQCIRYEWSNWESWSKCSKTCGGGVRYKTRSCFAETAQPKQVTNDKCGKDLFFTYDHCNQHSCVAANLVSEDAEHSYGVNQPTKPQCGRKQNILSQFGNTNRVSNVQLRIAGGENAQHGDWPWQVSFQHRQCRKINRNTRSCTWKHLCGASIVDNKWVITAAHCIAESGFYFDPKNPGEDWSVVVGMDKLNNPQLGKANAGKRIFLEKIKIHETYKFNYITHADIALLKLGEALEYNEYIQPICFPDGQKPQDGDRCHITGWGFTSGAGDELSYHLKEAEIPIVDFATCRNVDVWYRLLDGKVHMCAGDRVRGGVDSCGGDSGGPLSCKRPDGTFYLAGVTSFGFSDCGKKGHVGIYARMTEFEEWAKSTIKNDESNRSPDYSPYYEDFHNLDLYKSGSNIKTSVSYTG